MAYADLLLHGFAGSGASWNPVIQAADEASWRPNAPDLPGHCSQPVADGETIDSLAETLATSYEPVRTLAGYSMGGRIALQMALDMPGCAQRLVLISTSAGIASEGLRRERAREDARLAAQIREMSPNRFADLWLSTPLFADDPPEAQSLARERILESGTSGLAEALAAFGTGVMVPLWERLDEIGIPVLIVVGEDDVRYREIGEAMARRIPGAEVAVIPGCGHALPRVAPTALAALLAP